MISEKWPERKIPLWAGLKKWRFLVARWVARSNVLAKLVTTLLHGGIEEGPGVGGSRGEL